MISSQRPWPLDHDAGRFVVIFIIISEMICVGGIRYYKHIFELTLKYDD